MNLQADWRLHGAFDVDVVSDSEVQISARNRVVHMKQADRETADAGVGTVWKMLFQLPAPHLTAKGLVDWYMAGAPHIPGLVRQAASGQASLACEIPVARALTRLTVCAPGCNLGHCGERPRVIQFRTFQVREYTSPDATPPNKSPSISGTPGNAARSVCWNGRKADEPPVR